MLHDLDCASASSVPPDTLSRLGQPLLAGVCTDELARARTILQNALDEPALILDLPLARRALSYERTFLFGNATTSVWAISWAPGSRTSIHDHHCSCCYAVLDGTMIERWFDKAASSRAVCTHEFRREPGFLECMTPTGPNIHQMLNLAGQTAISLHVYGFDRNRYPSSIEREYEIGQR